jgi:hypothetical protein
MRLLTQHYKVVTATVDATAGEIGTVYQACGFDYVGQMTAGSRLRIHDSGATISERQARRRYGTSAIAALEARGLTVERVPRPSRYFAFRGSRGEQRELRAAIADRAQPYPKRVVIKSAGAVVIKNIGFVRVRKRALKDGGSAVTFDLLRSLRIDGKPTNKFVMTIGTQRSDRDDPRFWPRAVARMVAHGLPAQQRQRLVEEMVRKGAKPPGKRQEGASR